MERLLIALAIGAVCVVVARLIADRRPNAGPTQAGATPEFLDREDFVDSTTPWLLAVFSSATCLACADVIRAVIAFESGAVAFETIEVGEHPGLHRRYRIDSVPTTVLADATGIVRGAWVGPLGVDDRNELSEILSSG